MSAQSSRKNRHIFAMFALAAKALFKNRATLSLEAPPDPAPLAPTAAGCRHPLRGAPPVRFE